MRQYFVYVLKCECEAWYVGKTYHPARRWLDHLEGDGSVYTRLYRPLGMYVVKVCKTETEALWWECTMTTMLQRHALKVGGANKTRPSMAGRGLDWGKHDPLWESLWAAMGGV